MNSTANRTRKIDMGATFSKKSSEVVEENIRISIKARSEERGQAEHEYDLRG